MIRTPTGAPAPAPLGWAGGPRRSIRVIVILAAAALTTLAVVSAGMVSESNMRRFLTREVEARLLIEARHLATASTEPLLTDFPELTLHPLTKRIKSLQPEMAMVVVTDHEGVIQGDPDARRLGTPLENATGMAPVPTRERLAPGEVLVSDGRVMLASAPVTHRDGRSIGAAWVGLRMGYIEDLIARARWQQVIVLGLVLVACIVVASLLMSSLLRPIAALRAGIERIGRGDLETPLALRDRTELGQLAEAIDDMAGQIRDAQSEMLERERLSHEVELARQIQGSLIPNRPLECGGFIVEGSNRAAAEVGGDYYDHFVLPDGRIGLAIADVSGKGLAGCLVMSMLSALLRAYRDTHDSPAGLLATLDAQLGASLQPGAFVTMFYGILDPRTGALIYSSAGHTPALIHRRATHRLEWVRGKGMPLGAVRGGFVAQTLKDGVVQLDPGDTLVQFTDGINEAMGEDGELFGFRRVEETVLDAVAGGSDRILPALHRSVEKWAGGQPAFDDETLMVVRHADTAAVVPGPGGRRHAAGPLMRLAEARDRGAALRLAATLEDQGRIPDWLKAVLPASLATGQSFEYLSAAVFEACANIAEHGYRLDARKTFDVWWVPEPAGDTARGGRSGASRSTPSVEEPAGSSRGVFVILDRGVMFRADRVEAIDFKNPDVWRRGRGFGLNIMHRAMREIAYHPGTPEGNITVMTFEGANNSEEMRHAG